MKKLRITGIVLAIAVAFPIANAVPQYTHKVYMHTLKVVGSPSDGSGTVSPPGTGTGTGTGTTPGTGTGTGTTPGTGTGTGTTPAPGTDTSATAKVSTDKTDVSFASTTYVGGTSSGQSVRLTNPSTSPINFTSITTNNPEFSVTGECASIAAGGACDLQVAFTPTQSGTRTGVLTLVQSNGITTTISLTASSKASSVYFSTPTFADIVAPSQMDSTSTVTLTNDTPNSLAITKPTAFSSTSPRGNFSMVSTTCGSTLLPGTSCDTTFKMNPVKADKIEAVFSVSTGEGAKQVTLSGMAYGGAATLSPASIDFKAVAIGESSAVVPAILTNTGNRPLTVTGASMATGVEHFNQNNNCGKTLQVGQTCRVDAMYTPKGTVSEPHYGSVAFTHDGLGTKSLSLSGISVVPASASFAATSLKVGGGTTLRFSVDNASQEFAVNCTDNVYMTWKGQPVTSIYQTVTGAFAAEVPVTGVSAGTASCTVTKINAHGDFPVTVTIPVTQ